MSVGIYDLSPWQLRGEARMESSMEGEVMAATARVEGEGEARALHILSGEHRCINLSWDFVRSSVPEREEFTGRG